MDNKTRKILVRHLAKRYRRVRKKEKNIIVTELVNLAGYNRSYARYVLRNPPKFKKQKRLKPMIASYIAALRRHKELKVTYDERKLKRKSTRPHTIHRVLNLQDEASIIQLRNKNDILQKRLRKNLSFLFQH